MVILDLPIPAGFAVEADGFRDASHVGQDRQVPGDAAERDRLSPRARSFRAAGADLSSPCDDAGQDHRSARPAIRSVMSSIDCALRMLPPQAAETAGQIGEPLLQAEFQPPDAGAGAIDILRCQVDLPASQTPRKSRCMARWRRRSDWSVAYRRSRLELDRRALAAAPAADRSCWRGWAVQLGLPIVATYRSYCRWPRTAPGRTGLAGRCRAHRPRGPPYRM